MVSMDRWTVSDFKMNEPTYITVPTYTQTYVTEFISGEYLNPMPIKLISHILQFSVE
jgi:hypothetical protein